MDKFVMIDDTAGNLDSLECVDGCKHIMAFSGSMTSNHQ